MTPSFTLHLGDCIEVMRGMPDCRVDAIVTDPPYHLVANKKDDPRRASPDAKQRNSGFMGFAWDGGDIAFNVDMWREALRVLKPGGHLLAFSGTRTYHRMACAIEDAGFEIRDQIQWIYGSGFPKSHNLDGEWQGWGTALKPAHEPICVARKPLIGTVAENVLTHGTGALNIDACRIATSEELRVGAGATWDFMHRQEGRPSREGEASADRRYQESGGTNFAMMPGVRGGDPAGRWPANVIHDGSDEVLAAFPQAPGQMAAVGPEYGPRPSVNTYGDYGPRGQFNPRQDAGSAARFFYCAKASREDRNEGCEAFEKKPLNWSSGTQNPGSFQSAGPDKSARNHHPTVKPTELMRYLVRLVTPPGGTVIDPFMGSGSTGKAALLEGFNFIGIDITPEYIDIGRARIEHAARERHMATAQLDLLGAA